MATETRRLGSIRQVTDDDTGQSFCGEVDGGFDEDAVAAFFECYGEDGYKRLCAHLVYMGATAREVWHRTRDVKTYQTMATTMATLFDGLAKEER